MNHSLYPLRFKPVLRQYLWGGRGLESVLGKQLGPGDDYAESWEVVDHGEQQSVVMGGPLAGLTLSRLVAEHGPALLGRHHPQTRFPLLFKFLDAQRNLSVQVHPSDPPDQPAGQAGQGKTEAWVILSAQPGSQIWAGLKRGFDRAALAREVARGTTELCLHKFEPQPGDCVFLPAGTVHALGSGLVVAEIQQTSNTTFRLYDWNRVGADGNRRELHVEQALEAIDYDYGPIGPQTPAATSDPQVQRLIACDKFVLDRCRFDTRRRWPADQRCHILAILSGTVSVSGDPAPEPLRRGDTLLLPASCEETEFVADCMVELLDMYLP